MRLRSLPLVVLGAIVRAWVRLNRVREHAHGAVSLKLASSLVFNVPSLRAQYEACVARWKRAEHQQLVELFERACDHTSSEAVRSALERLLPRK